jgi:hypothetical protein
MDLTGLWGDPRRVVSALALAGYVGIAFAVHNFYPFSVFDMYSRAQTSASRVVVRDGSGQVAEVERYDRWRCDGEIDVSPAKCGTPGSFTYTPYIDASRVGYIAGHTVSEASGDPVEVVRRIWWLDAPGAPRTTDCVLQRCTAVRR